MLLQFITVESLDLQQAVQPYHELTLQAALAPGCCGAPIRRKAWQQQLLLPPGRDVLQLLPVWTASQRNGHCKQRRGSKHIPR